MDEHSPLLRDQAPNTSASAKTIEDAAHDSFLRKALRYALLFGFVFATGIVAWAVNRAIHPKNGSEPVPPREDEVIEWRSQLLGYASAILFREFIYLPSLDALKQPFPVIHTVGARIPQICEYSLSSILAR